MACVSVSADCPHPQGPYFFRMCLWTSIVAGIISSSSLCSLPMQGKGLPQQAQVFSSSGRSWMISTRGRSSGSGFRPRFRRTCSFTTVGSQAPEPAASSMLPSSASLNRRSLSFFLRRIPFAALPEQFLLKHHKLFLNPLVLQYRQAEFRLQQCWFIRQRLYGINIKNLVFLHVVKCSRLSKKNLVLFFMKQRKMSAFHGHPRNQCPQAASVSGPRLSPSPSLLPRVRPTVARGTGLSQAVSATGKSRCGPSTGPSTTAVVYS